MSENNKGLSFFNIALIYVGTFVGAGFASGREIWQFFGVFLDKGEYGIFLLTGVLFVASLMTTLIARFLRTNDIGRVVFPSDNRKYWDITGYFMAFMLFIALVIISSAGGSLLYQQFGIHRYVGNIIVVALTCITVIGGLDRIGKVFRKTIPILIGIMIIICILALNRDLPPGDIQVPVEPSPMANHFLGAAILYVSYNMLGVIPIVTTTSTEETSSTKAALKGAALGSILLSCLAMLVYKTLIIDPGYSQAMDMPMLAIATKLGPFANVLYSVVLMVAIYSAASGNFYGFTTKIKNGPKKKRKIIIACILAAICSFSGFKFLVAYLLPIQGLCGAAIVTLMVINFIRVIVFNYATNQEKEKYNFPPEIINVTTGHGAASLLVVGTEKTALMDCSMAYCGEHLVAKIKEQLGDRPLDYFFASHTHYDHIGALPYLRKAWPNLICVGAEHGQQVLKREGAIRGIKKLGDEAAKMYTNGKMTSVSVEGLSIDQVVHDRDVIDLGGKQIVTLETPGHTRCSLTFVVEPAGIMMASESVGVLERRGISHPAVLQSFEDGIKSIEKCRDYNPKRIIISHYGIIPASYNNKLWEIFENEMRIEKHVIEEAWENGMTEDEILEMMTDKYWYEGRANEQPVNAFRINMRSTIKLYKKDK